MSIELSGGNRITAGELPLSDKDPLSFTLDKFTFTILSDRLYHPDGLWVMESGERLLIGVTDFFQQNSGDVAFAEVAEPGTVVAAGERLANIETIKIDNELASPVSGTVVEVNDKLTFEAEVINQSPYEDGWLAFIAPSAWNRERAGLLSPEAYLDINIEQARREVGK